MEDVWRCRPTSSVLQGWFLHGWAIYIAQIPTAAQACRRCQNTVRNSHSEGVKPKHATQTLMLLIIFAYAFHSHRVESFLSPFFFTLSQMLRQTTGVYVVEARSFHTSQSIAAQISFMLNQHLCSNQIWVISNCIMLVNMPGKITDKLASRWRVTCSARKKAPAATAWHRGLPRNVVEHSAVTCSATGDVTSRDRNGEIDHVRLWCQRGSWLRARALITM